MELTSRSPLSTVAQQRTSLFGTLSWDTSQHDFLRLRVKSSGDGMRYFVNIQTDGPGAISRSLGCGAAQFRLVLSRESRHTIAQSAPTSSNTVSGCPNPNRTTRLTNGLT